MLKSYSCFVYFEIGRWSVQKQETEEQTGELPREQPFRNAYASKLATLRSLCQPIEIRGLWRLQTGIINLKKAGFRAGFPFLSLLPIPLAARFAHRLVFAASLFVSPFSTDWNAELHRL